jgi:hypothetical protein
LPVASSQFPVPSSQFPVRSVLYWKLLLETGYWKLVTGS